MNKNIKINIEPSWFNSIEHKCLSFSGFKCEVSNELNYGYVRIGSVDYCRKLYNWPACDPYPDWLPWGRKIFKNGIKLSKAFYKPFDIPKRFNSCIMNNQPSGKWVASEIVNFVSEYRAYVVDGKVLTVKCYSNFDNDEEICFPWEIPTEITAAIDFGYTDDGRLLPIEVNDPYAIGWYDGLHNGNLYSEFVAKGWEYMLNKFKGENK